MQKFKALGDQAHGQDSQARGISTGSPETRDKAANHRIAANNENNRNCVSSCFGGECGRLAVRRNDRGYPTLN